MGHVAYNVALAASVTVLTPSLSLSAEAPSSAVVAVVESVCLPLIGKQPIDTIARSAGLSRKDGDWTLSMQGAGSVRVSPPSAANPATCMGRLEYERAAGPSMRAAIGAWAGAKGLAAIKSDEQTKNSYLQYRTSSWSGQLNGKSTTVVFTEQTELDGKPTAGSLDEATLLVNAAG
jgi:hypothetical protein